MDGRRARKDGEMTRDPNGVRQPPPVQRSPKGGHVAELGIGQYGGDLQPRGTRAPDQRQRLTPFLLEGRAGGNSRHRPAIAIAEPILRDISSAPVSQARALVHSAAVTATWQFAQSCQAPHRTAARRQPNGCPVWGNWSVDDQHAAALVPHLEEPPPDPIRIPDRVRDEMLKGL
jgi:hypothetical protein